MDAELKDLVKEMSQERDLTGTTLLKLRDGRRYQLPIKLEEWEIDQVQYNCPDDQILSILGQRLPDAFCFIETSPVYSPYLMLAL
jgi:hypothetical protein